MEEDFKKIDVKPKILRNSYFGDNKIIHFKNQNYDALKNECLRTGKLFEDQLFTPSNRSLYYTKQIPRGIKWMRLLF